MCDGLYKCLVLCYLACGGWVDVDGVLCDCFGDECMHMCVL